MAILNLCFLGKIVPSVMTNSIKRKASCHCGQFVVAAMGDPLRVVICYCEDCQRRTGSSYNLGVVFDESQLRLKGEFNCYHRSGDLGLEIEYHFCPECGSNVHWIYDGAHVVAGGCFANSDFPKPTMALYGKRKHNWLHPLTEIPNYPGSRNSKPEYDA